MIPFVDPHHHLWDVERNRYPWLQDVDHDRGWGDWSALRRNYLAADFMADADGLELVKSVHVQANYDPSDPVGETRWLHEIAADPAARGIPHGIVAFADLSAPDAARTLDAHLEWPRVRGIRQVLNRHPDPKLNRAPRDFLGDPRWRDNLGLLAGRGLSFDAQVYHHQMKDLAELARRYPDLAIVLDHAGMPAERDPENLEGWRQAMARLAEAPNVVVKLSGFGMVDLTWTPDSIRPFVLHCIDCFGPSRSMFASNFPVDKLMSGYRRLWEAFDSLTEDFSDDERREMFRGTAERIYRI
ncbi:amidohydrolase family protein [Oceanibacterium hippocampi]|uniref:Amidohydrolase n=1 Tax=Oceanibacterium hippocampi TaxID=745714 RepID=A0A1Y5TWQ2_9PROT|nr:amidohydrolase family protein [Oceanibacterium hippocampi]SLN75619.1 Amidohydrolase [Oceanibacterium hippocampi]